MSSDDSYEHLYQVTYTASHGRVEIMRQIGVPNDIHKSHGDDGSGKIQNWYNLSVFFAETISIGRETIKEAQYRGMFLKAW